MEIESSENNATKTRQHNSGAADLEKVTDYAEEKEILDVGSGNLNNAMNAISDKRKKEADQKAEKEKQLASVKVKKEEVELLVNEFEIVKSKAERVLKEHSGDLSSALAALINS
jgi:NACalpha-BTF3-like transcription factor